MTNFFEHQANARRATNYLVVLYGLAVAAIVAAVVFATRLVYFARYTADLRTPTTLTKFDLMVALLTLFIIGCGTMIRMITLGGRGERVAELLGGELLSRNTQDPLERRLLNVVEEMAIASGIPVPPVYILRREDSINAFAAGLKPTEAVIGVTRGTLEQLSRDELQGVIAHEFSHIFNGDMRLNYNLVGVLAGITSMVTLGRLLLEFLSEDSSSRRSRGNAIGGLAILGIAFIIVGAIGAFFASMIKAAVSRQREFLADASAVQYTRNPLGIGGALLKIAHHSSHARVRSAYAGEMSHMFFGEVEGFFSDMFATHPPIDERIKRTSPWLLTTEALEQIKSANHAAETNAMMNHFSEDVISSNLQSQGAQWLQKRTETPDIGKAYVPSRPSTPKEIVSAIGEPSQEDVNAAKALLKRLPDEIHEATRTAEGAKAIVCAMIIGENSSAFASQWSLISKVNGPAALSYTTEIRKKMALVGEAFRLPLLELALPALRELDYEERKSFLSLLRELAEIDQQYTLFEYVIITLISNQLEDRAQRVFKLADRKPLAHYYEEASVVLSAFTHVGAKDEGAARLVLAKTLPQLQPLGLNPRFCPREVCQPKALEPSLKALRRLAPEDLQKLITACVHLILGDGKVTHQEVELLHVVCLALGVPVPRLAATA